MHKIKEKVGFRELVVLIVVLIGIKSQDVTTVTLFKLGKTATWMIPIIWLLVMGLPIFATFSLLKKYKNKSIIEIIHILTGKYIGFIISFTLFLMLLLANSLDNNSYIDVMKMVMYPKTPFIILLIYY